MKHTRTFFTLLFMFAYTGLFPFQAVVQAVDKPIGYEKICLKAEKVIQMEGEKTIRKRKLTGTGMPIGKPIYIVSITQSKAGQIITTGDPTADAELAPFGAQYVAGVMKYVSGQAKMSSVDGSIEAVVNAVPSYAPARHTPAQYFAVFPRDPQPTINPGASGTEGGLQQGPIGMDTLFSPGSTKDCAAIQWDPEGRAFDANTLEPMENVEVTILDAAKKPVNQAGVKNPDMTDILGNYTFYVEEGDYYLSIKAPASYVMAEQVSDVHQNYSKAYSTLYRFDEKIVERIDTPEEEAQGYPNIERRDIALVSVTMRETRPLAILAHTEITAEDGEVYSGQTTHPLTKISIKQGGTEIAFGEADKNGSYSVPIASSVINPQQPIDIGYEKVDLTQLAIAQKSSWLERLVGSVFAQQNNTITIRTQPILQNIEGYAYDQNGAVIPFAMVNLQLKNNGATAYTVKADETGYFTVPVEAAPNLPYYFEFIDPKTNSTIKKETSEFSVNNNVVGKFKNTTAQAREIPDQIPDPTGVPTGMEGLNALSIGSILFILLLGGVTAWMTYKKKQERSG
ncbi:MAG: carboxypeptidase-like regulatory domain-containing protein [Microgenomates group bacterium]